MLCMPMTRTDNRIDSLIAESTNTSWSRAALVHSPLYADKTRSHYLRISSTNAGASGKWKRSRNVLSYSELVRRYRQAFLPGKSAARIRIMANIVPIKLLFRLPMKWNRDAKACITAIRSATYEVVQKRQAEPVEKHKRQDILSVMLGSPLFKDNTDLMVSQCMAFLAAGREASALALGWTLYELSQTTSDRPDFVKRSAPTCQRPAPVFRLKPARSTVWSTWRLLCRSLFANGVPFIDRQVCHLVP